MAVLLVDATELVDMANDVVADGVDDGPLDPTMRAYSCDMADRGSVDLFLTSAVCTLVAD